LWWRARSVESRQPFKRKVDEPILDQLQPEAKNRYQET
jgi:hypothetical protein